MTYTYDGDGNRVEKSNGRLFWYGAGTEILDESDLTGSITLEMVYFGGKRVAHRTSSNVIYYYEGDMLGSARSIVQAGQTTVCYDADFLPFGGERVITNTCTQNYKFEGKKRDLETGNDDFGARYYRSNLGRWMSADWSSVPAPVPYANLTNPQTLNLYAMVSDNPETFADLDGHCGTGALPGAPSSAQPCQNGSTHTPVGGDHPPALQKSGTQQVLQVVSDTLVGGAKGALNQVIGLSNMINKGLDSIIALTGSKFSFGQVSELQGSTSGEKSAMAGVSVGSFFTGLGEEKSAAKGTALVEEIFNNPKALGSFLSESHAQSLGGMLKGLGWDVGTLAKGSREGQGVRALELNSEGKMTGRAISWHPGGGHHGPSPYWKVSSPRGGTVRVGPQFP